MILDSLHHTVQPIVQTHQSNPNFDLVYYVNNFYEQAWNKLTWVIGVLFGLIGVALPLFVQSLNRRSLSLSETQMRREIADAIQNARIEINQQMLELIDTTSNQLTDEINITKDALKNEIDALLSSAKGEINIAIEDSKGEVISNATNIIEEKVKILEVKFQEINNNHLGRSFQTQANAHMGAKRYNDAFVNYLIAIKYYCLSNQKSMPKKLIKFILENIPKTKLTKEGIDKNLDEKGNILESIQSIVIANREDLSEDFEKIINLYQSLRIVDESKT